MLAAVALLVLPTLVVIAGLKDAISYTIPNWIPLILMAAFGPAALIAGLPLGQIGLCLAVGFAALLAGMAMFALRWLGGGDAKLMAACLLWLGLAALPVFLLVTALAGGALALGLLALRSVWLRPLADNSPAWIGRLATPDAPAPYGVAICIGALAAFPFSAIAGALRGVV